MELSGTVERAADALQAGEQRAQARLRFLSEASEVLAGSLDYQTILDNLVSLIVPALAGVSPEMERRVVDLPAPLEPIRVTTSPASTVSDTPFSASIAP